MRRREFLHGAAGFTAYGLAAAAGTQPRALTVGVVGYISQEVLTGAQVDALAPYRPTRFGGVSPVGTLMGAGASLALTA